MLANQLLSQRYRLLQVLGAGGMSQAYLAEDTQRPNNPHCVVKKLQPLSQDPKLLAVARVLFNREAEVLEQLGEHAQIPRLLAHFEENQEFYLVEEFITGHPLYVELQPGQRWSETEAIKFLLEILPILEFIHSRGVIHRDIKPDNIIRREGDRKLVLIDFGAVRQVKANLTISNPVQAGTVVGTYGYMPTEQAHGNPRPNSDIYALGIVCIQALTGLLPSQLPLDAQTGEVCWQNFVPISKDLVTVLTKMVRYHFKDRYQTATEALEAVKTLERKRMPKPSKFRQPLLVTGLGIGAIAATILGAQAVLKPNIQASLGGDRILDIGVLNTSRNNPEANYNDLATYLEKNLQKNLNNQVKVKLHLINMTQEGGLKQAKQEIKAQNWELAFTGVPLLSAAAVANKYQFAARMSPNLGQSESVLFVRQDSPIRSVDDLTADKTIALGGFNQASGFYMPVYDLYGKTLRVDLNNTTSESMEKVRSGKVDVAAGFGLAVKKASDLRIIHVSRALPMSGVYLAPKLTKSEQQVITNTLLQAPADIQQKARYGRGQEVSYSQFLRIVRRVEEVTSCTNWQQNPVNLFCSSIVGTTNGYRSFDDAVHFTLQGNDGKIYRLVLPRTILDQDPDLDAPGAINLRKVAIKKVQPIQVNGVLELRITEPGQVTLIS